MKPFIVSILLLSVVLVAVPGFAQAQTPFVPCGRVDQQDDPANAVCNFQHLVLLIVRIINYLIGVAAIVAMYHVLLAAFDMISSLGKPEKIESGKKTISNAVVGFGIIILVFVFVNLLVNGVLGNAPTETRQWWNINCIFNITETDLSKCGVQQTGGPPGGGNQPPPPSGQSSLVVTKVVVNDGGGTAQVSDFQLSVNSTQVTSGTAQNFSPGSYSVSESGPNGYNSSFSGDCDNSGNITMEADRSYSCTITNDDTGGGGPPPTDPAALAAAILINSNITIDVNADCPPHQARENLQDIQAGRFPYVCSPSCGCVRGGSTGMVTVNPEILRGLMTLSGQYRFILTSLSTGKHSSTSPHYRGEGADVIPNDPSPNTWKAARDFLNTNFPTGTAFCEDPTMSWHPAGRDGPTDSGSIRDPECHDKTPAGAPVPRRHIHWTLPF